MALRPAPRVRLAELIASLTLATDLGLGQPQEHVLRQTVIADRVARLAGMTDRERAASFYVSLLGWVGCVADSHELTRWFDDDTHVRGASYAVDRTGLPMLRFLLGQVATTGSPAQRISMLGRFLTVGVRDVAGSMVSHCEVTGDIADRLGLTGEVRRALPQVWERWDGKGPGGLAGERIERVMRVIQLANDSEVFWRIGGIDAAVQMLRERSGTAFDPALVDLVSANVDDIFGGLADIDAWTVVIAGCAPLDRELDEAELAAALDTLADSADLKTPWFHGHSWATSALVAEAARRAGMPAHEVEIVGQAALVARLGTIGVSSRIWDRPAPLSRIELERVRQVPYLTERILSRQPRLAELGAIAGMIHERLDGSGYPRGLTGASIPPTARVLAAAEVYQALGEARPHRRALPPAEAQAVLMADAAAGRLDADAVHAVLAAAGHRPRRRPSHVAGLSGREIEILRHLVRGASNRQIADTLYLSPRTVNSHVEHIYAKIGVSARGAAAMFALRHGLVSAIPEAEAEAPVGIG